MLAVDTQDALVPVGIAAVMMDKNGEPDVLFRTRRVKFEGCEHHYWVVIAPSTEALAEQLDQFILWRGPFAQTGESLMEWFMHQVHEGKNH